MTDEITIDVNPSAIIGLFFIDFLGFHAGSDITIHPIKIQSL
jgi:hypothetical protein